jgi:hypothetical protein
MLVLAQEQNVLGTIIVVPVLQAITKGAIGPIVLDLQHKREISP